MCPMYIKTFVEDFEEKGEFFPVSVNIYAQLNDDENAFGDFRVTYSVDGNSKEKPFYPLFAGAVREGFGRRSALRDDDMSAPDEIRVSVVDGLCLVYYFSPVGALEEQVSFESLLQAVDAEEYITVRVDVLGPVAANEGETKGREVMETYEITAGWEDGTLVANISIETQNDSEELSIS